MLPRARLNGWGSDQMLVTDKCKWKKKGQLNSEAENTGYCADCYESNHTLAFSFSSTGYHMSPSKLWWRWYAITRAPAAVLLPEPFTADFLTTVKCEKSTFKYWNTSCWSGIHHVSARRRPLLGGWLEWLLDADMAPEIAPIKTSLHSDKENGEKWRRCDTSFEIWWSCDHSRVVCFQAL